MGILAGVAPTAAPENPVMANASVSTVTRILRLDAEGLPMMVLFGSDFTKFLRIRDDYR